VTAAFDAPALTISSAVVTSIWEGAILFALVGIALRLLPNLSAATRYCVWLCTLLACIVVPVGTVAGSTARTAEAPVTGTFPVSAVTSDESNGPVNAANPSHAAATQQISPAGPHYARITMSRDIALAIAVLWVLGASLRGILLAWNFRQLSSLRSKARLWPCTYDLPVWVSDCADVPLAIGFFRRGVILPACVVERQPADAIDAIVLHEIAHLRRYDVWTNALARVAEVLLVLNPFARLVMRRLATEREIACDDVVVTQLGSGRIFARALAALAMPERRVTPIAAPSAIGSKHSIVVRIERLLDAHPRTIRLSLSTLGGALMFLALIAMLMQTISPVLAYAPQNTLPSHEEVAAACAIPDRAIQMESYVDTYHGRKTFWRPPWPLSTGERYWGTRNIAVLDVTVDPSGKVQEVTVVSSPDAKAAQVGVRQFERITYRPAMKNCVAVTSTFRTWYPVRSRQQSIYSIVRAVYPSGWSMHYPSSCRVPDLIHGGVPSLSGVNAEKTMTAAVRVDVAPSGTVSGAAIANSSGNTAFDNATLAAARSATYPLNDNTGFKPVRPSGADLSWNAAHGYGSFSKCTPLPSEYVWTATFKPAGSSLFQR